MGGDVATADQLRALVKSHAEGDDRLFYSVALQVAARAARGGQNRFATELRDLVESLRTQQPGPLRPPTPLAVPRGELAGLLSASYPTTKLADLVLEPSVRHRLDLVVLEQRQQAALREQGFEPMRRLLLVGPPGTGKTMTASALASELRLPLLVIRLDGLITKYLGETAAKLRLIFDAMTETRGLYLFDEVDALAGERSRAHDVGEIRRVLNSFLQFLEQDPSDSLLVAATNHPQLLDEAMFRRFDAVIEYPLPDATVIEGLVRSRLTLLGTNGVDWLAVGPEASGLSHAEITLAAERAAKDAILGGQTAVSTGALVSALKERRSARRG